MNLFISLIKLYELNVILWALAFSLGYLVVYGLNLPEIYSGHELSKSATYIYGGFHRLAWGLALGWLVFACCRGYGGAL